MTVLFGIYFRILKGGECDSGECLPPVHTTGQRAGPPLSPRANIEREAESMEQPQDEYFMAGEQENPIRYFAGIKEICSGNASSRKLTG